MQLTSAEAQLMKYLWKLEKAFMKDLVEAYPEPRPAYTTIATLLTRMIDKQFIDYHQYGKVREYYPKISRNEYFSKEIKTMIQKFFNNSSSQFASFFAHETDLDLNELEELKQIVERQIEIQKKKDNP